MPSLFILFVTGFIIGDILNVIIRYFCHTFSAENPVKYALKDLIASGSKNSLIASLLISNNIKNFEGNLSYAIIVSVTIALTVAMKQQYDFIFKGLAALIFAYTLIILTFIDAKTQILPDIFTKPLILIGLIQGYFSIFTDFRSSLIGAVAGYGIFWSINALFKLIRKKEGMGGGDFKLLSAIGAWTGYMNLPLVIMLSSFIAVIGAVITAPLIGKKINQPLPYGPYLAISGLIALCFGQQIVAAYLKLIGY